MITFSPACLKASGPDETFPVFLPSWTSYQPFATIDKIFVTGLRQPDPRSYYCLLVHTFQNDNLIIMETKFIITALHASCSLQIMYLLADSPLSPTAGAHAFPLQSSWRLPPVCVLVWLVSCSLLAKFPSQIKGVPNSENSLSDCNCRSAHCLWPMVRCRTGGLVDHGSRPAHRKVSFSLLQSTLICSPPSVWWNYQLSLCTELLHQEGGFTVRWNLEKEWKLIQFPLYMI